jgi:hypothetical protein
MYHDETTFEGRPEIAEDMKGIMERAINDAGKHFNLSIEQTGDGAIGLNWSQVHSPWWVGLFIMYVVALSSFPSYLV